MKLNKDFKREVDLEVEKGNYILKKVISKSIVFILILSILGGVFSFGMRWFSVNANREIFKQSVTYNEGVLDDLAKYKLEMIQADDEIEKIAIAEMVVQRFANYDESKIETEDLKQFLKDCRNMNLEEY